ncbi:MAG: deoxycytidylate deaminase, partial [Luteibaculum sp.]
TKQDRFDRAYLRMAEVWGELSHCRRKKVGALIVKDGMIISDGFNGTPSGFPNDCEDENYETHWYVLHAEANAITKVAKSTNNAKNATLYITLSPCMECCKLILQTGIKRVVYSRQYRNVVGLEILREAGIIIKQIENP